MFGLKGSLTGSGICRVLIGHVRAIPCVRVVCVFVLVVWVGLLFLGVCWLVVASGFILERLVLLFVWG